MCWKLEGHKCPDCGEEDIEISFACPGYDQGGGQIMICASSCSNAKCYTCQNCFWSWQDEMHPKRSRFAENEAKRPPWADEVF